MLPEPRGGVTLSRSDMRRSYHSRRGGHAVKPPIHLLPLKQWKAHDRHVLQVPFVVEALGNFRGHTRSGEHVRYVARQRAQTALFLMCTMKRPKLPARVRLVRIAPRGLDEDDNLPRSFKHVRDGIADWLGINDKSRKVVHFTYDNEPAGVRVYGARIEILLAP